MSEIQHQIDEDVTQVMKIPPVMEDEDTLRREIPWTPWYKNYLILALLAFLAAMVATIAVVASN